jgi:metal-sulfur cluster biosynthetic enzyme
MENENPVLRAPAKERFELSVENGKLRNVCRESVFELLRDIKDPEHPYTLEQLGIITLEDTSISEIRSKEVMCKGGQPIKVITVVFTPTVPHCSMAGIIGLCISYQLDMHIDGYAISVVVKRDTHSTDVALNKQLSDRDRVMAAFENEGLLEVIKSCIGI